MRNYRLSWFTAPLYLAALCGAGLFALAFPSLPAGRRGLFCALGAGILAMLICVCRRMGIVEAAVRNSRALSDEDRLLPVSRQFRRIVEEAGDATRRQVTTALADKQAEINALQSQINPHFLYNTLDSIRGQALIDGSPAIADMTEALSILFRYSISRSGNLVPLRDELRCIEKYIMIQQFRFGDKFVFHREIDEGLLSCMIPRLTLQPIVENAIFHGLESQAEGGVITVELKRCGTYLVVRVLDNGAGISESQLLKINEQLRISTLTAGPVTGKKGSGIALGNVNRRIRLAFGEQYGLVISSSPGLGTDVEISLPVVFSSGKKEDVS